MNDPLFEMGDFSFQMNDPLFEMCDSTF